jgi:DNA-binding CsgD family transcriptional regulator
MLDVQLAALYTGLGDFDTVLELTTCSASMAQRLGLNLTRGAALLFQAEVYARRGPDRPAMEASLRAALAAGQGDRLFEAEAQGAAWADSRAMASLVEENRPRALRDLDTAQESFRLAHGGAPSPGRGLWVLLSTLVDSARGAEACREVAGSQAMIHPINQAFVRYSQAMLAGRAGRPAEADRAMADADALLAVSSPWYQHLARRLVAEEAIARGWGEPARWLREAAPFFDQHGQPRVASACRSLLRKLGAPARAARAHPSVPPRFRARGVTTREMEVLSVIGEGLSNREIGARLYLSPKTVEKHIASLMDKLDVRTRAQLAAIAASGSVPA